MFTFLKKHYEKIILTFLLIVFVVLLVIQLGMLLEGRGVNTDELRVVLNPDYQRKNFKDAKYAAKDSLSSTPKWKNAEPRNPASKVFSDLCAPIELARCPFCEHLVPTLDFKSGKCSYCEHVLPPRINPEDEAKDGGIPPSVMAQYGVKPDDLELDFSKNGFTNKEKILGGFNLRDPKSHPSYATKLFVVEVVRKKLNIKIDNILIRGEDKSKWTMQVKILDGGKERTRFVAINGKFKCDDGEYTLLDIVPEFKTELDAKLNAQVERNYSKATLRRTGSDENLLGEIGKDIVESKEKIVLLYAISNKTLSLYVGDSLTLGDERTGVEKFTIVSCDPARSTVTIKADGSGKTFELLPRRIVEKPADNKFGPPGNLPF